MDLHARDKFGKTVLQFAKNDEVFRFLYNVESQDRLQPHLYDGPQVRETVSLPCLVRAVAVCSV